MRAQKKWFHRSALLVVLALSACTSVREPKIELEGVRLGSLGLAGGTLVVDVRVENPNRFTLRADDLRYQLALRESGREGAEGWVDVATGTYPEQIEVRGRETRTFRIPVEFSYRDLSGAARSLLRTGHFDYRAIGTVDVQTPVGTREVPFRKTGSFTLTGAG